MHGRKRMRGNEELKWKEIGGGREEGKINRNGRRVVENNGTDGEGMESGRRRNHVGRVDFRRPARSQNLSVLGWAVWANI